MFGNQAKDAGEHLKDKEHFRRMRRVNKGEK